MKLSARQLSGIVLLCAFSSASFAWGSWSSWVSNGNTGFCKATRSDRSERWASVSLNWFFVCPPPDVPGLCTPVGMATIMNVTSTTQRADIAGMSRVGGDTYFEEKFNVPAFTQPISLTHAGYVRNELDNATARCQVQ